MPMGAGPAISMTPLAVDERQERANGADPQRSGRARGARLGLSAAIVAAVFLGYGVPLFGLLLSLAVLIALLVVRRELWGAAVPRSALLAVLVRVGLWLPAISYSLTGWYWKLTERDLSTAWLLLPMQGPADMIVGTLGPGFGRGRGVRRRVDGIWCRGSALARGCWRMARSMGTRARVHHGHRDGLIAVRG